MDPLEFRMTSVHLRDDVYVVTLGGELDLANVAQVDQGLESLVLDGARRVIVDLLDVPFLESRTLGALLRHARRLRANGGELTLVSDDRRVLRVIEITGLMSHFRVEPSLTRAIDAELEAIAG